MIELTKLNSEKFYMNPNLIETIEETPDTMITITNGKKFYVLETVEVVISRIEEYYQRVYITVKKLRREESDKELSE